MKNELLNPRYSGETKIEEEDLLDLLVPITTLKEADEAEVANITQALEWVYGRKRKLKPEQILTSKWLKNFHKLMFGDVWAWAGKYRTRDTIPGTSKHFISREFESLLSDISSKASNIEKWEIDPHDLALEFAYRAVVIHPFKNGNGRWSRETANVLLHSLGAKEFTWGNSISIRTRHDEMMIAIHKADKGYFSEFKKFAQN